MSIEIKSMYSVRARFDAHFFPRKKDLHEVAWVDSMEEALAELETVKKHGGYDRAEIVRQDVQFIDGMSRGMVHKETVKEWKRTGGAE